MQVLSEQAERRVGLLLSPEETLAARRWTRLGSADRMRAERYFDAGEGAKAV